MAVKISNISFNDYYNGIVTPVYRFNAGDYYQCRIDFSVQNIMISSQTNQMSYSALTGEFNISVGSWYDEGFRVGQTITFSDWGQNNTLNGTFTATILSMPTDKTIVLSYLPSANNVTPDTGHIWVVTNSQSVNEVELLIGYTTNSNTQTEPIISSPIDSEVGKLMYSNLSSLAVTNGAGPGNSLTQVGKKSGGFEIQNAKIYRYSDDTFAGATRYNYTIFFETNDIGIFFPSLYAGNDCMKFVFKLTTHKNIGDTKGQSVFYVTNSNSGWFNEAYNTGISDINSFSTASDIYYNSVNNVTFQIVAKDSVNSNIQLGSAYITLDDQYNLNENLSQSSFCSLLYTGLLNSGSAGASFGSTNLPSIYSSNNYSITINSISVTSAGGFKTFNVDINIDFEYVKNGTANSSFGNFIENRGTGDRNFYLWCKVGNTNCLIYGQDLEFQLPVGHAYEPNYVRIINHDDNDNYFNLSTDISGVHSCTDINEEDDLALVSDLEFNLADYEPTAVNVYLLARDYVQSGKEFVLESMTFDLQNNSFQNFVNIFQNVSNNLPSSSNKKTAYIKKTDLVGNIFSCRLYYPFLVRWEYWLSQNNATQHAKSLTIDNKKWVNYSNLLNGLKTFVKIGIVRDGVEDYYYKEIKIYRYDVDAPNITSTIELIDLDTNAPSNVFVSGKKYQIKATHIKNASWNSLNTCYGMITIEQKESAPRYIVSNEIDADLIGNPLIPNVNKRMDMTLTAPNTIVMTCEIDSSVLTSSEYCISSKISEEGSQNNPIFEKKITSDTGEDKITSGLVNDNKFLSA